MAPDYPLFQLPSPFEIESGTVLMQEPPWARAGELRAQLLDESYPRPFVIDDGERRYLYFNVRLMQSAMRLDAPTALDLRYTQKMMAFLLFNPKPKRLVLPEDQGRAAGKHAVLHRTLIVQHPARHRLSIGLAREANCPGRGV